MKENRKPYTFDRVVRICISTLLFITICWFLSYLSEVLIPFVVAFLIAYLINPLVGLLQKHVIKNRVIAVFLSLIIVFGTIIAGCWLVLPMIGSEIQHMGVLVTQISSDTSGSLTQRAEAIVPPDIWNDLRRFLKQTDIMQYLQNEKFMESMKIALSKIMPIGVGIFSSAISILLGLIGASIILLYLVFLLLDFQKVKNDWKALIPPAYRPSAIAFVHDFNIGMNRYFRAQATIASIVGILFAIGFSIIGLPLGIVIGLFIGLLNMIPYMQIIGVFPSLLMALAASLETGESFWYMSGLVLVVFAVVQTIQDTILTPKIMGDVTGFSPAIILLALSIWGKLLGILGLLIALPMTCLLWAYYKRVLSHTLEDSTLSLSYDVDSEVFDSEDESDTPPPAEGIK